MGQTNHKNESIRSPLAKARGLGSAKEGVEHWIRQRITAVANLFLVLWLCFSFLSLPLMNYDTVTQWLSAPHNAILMILAVISVFSHAVLGSEVIIEDYVHNKGFKIFKLLAVKFIYFGLGVACIFSILKISF